MLVGRCETNMFVQRFLFPLSSSNSFFLSLSLIRRSEGWIGGGRREATGTIGEHQGENNGPFAPPYLPYTLNSNMCIYIVYTRMHLYTAHTYTPLYTRVCTNFGRSHGQRVRIYPPTFPFTRARSTFVLDNEYIRHGIWIGVSRLLCDRRWECAELIATPERPGFRIYPVERKRRRGFSTLIPRPSLESVPEKSTAWTSPR